MSDAYLVLRSVKYDAGDIEISAVEEHQATSDKKDITLKSSEEPRPEFIAPFVTLTKHVRRLIGVPSYWADEGLTVKKVVWSKSEKTGVRGATICCQAKLSCADAPLIFNTPHLPFEQYSPTANAPTMPEAIIAVLNELEAEALAFMDGRRAQGELFDSAADAPSLNQGAF